MTRFSLGAWPLVLTLAVRPSAAFAQSFACYTLQRGDTASRAAKRITGNASNKYQPWFDIIDFSDRSVPKSQYDRIRSGWRACIPERTAEYRAQAAPQAVAVATDGAAAPEEIKPAAGSAPDGAAPDAAAQVFQGIVRPSAVAVRTSLAVDPTPIWLAAAVSVPALGLLLLGGYVRRRNTARIFMTQFAHLFVREFERPLLRHVTEPAMRAQLRVHPYRARLEICLAPGKGRRYPNLSDHRKNVEYDVDRVLSSIADESFVCGRLRMKEGWVVVPFRFSARLKERGVRCISSL